MSKKKSRSSIKKSKVAKRNTNSNKETNDSELNDDRGAPTLIEGEERKVHEEIIDRRIRGGAALTEEDITEAYSRALKQWQELPGSIVRPPTDVILPSQKRAKFQDTHTNSQDTNDGTHKGEE